MLLHRLKVSGLLSFGPKGVDLPMAPLNVLIGPNGSGKSNLLEAIALLRSTTSDLAEPIARRGRPAEFFWKGTDAQQEIHIEALVDYLIGSPEAATDLRHVLKVGLLGRHVAVTHERVEPLDADLHRGQGMAFELSSGSVMVDQTTSRSHQVTKVPAQANREASMLRSPSTREELRYLREKYEAIRLYRNWSFGPDARLRMPCYADGPDGFLDEDGGNLALVLSDFHYDHKRAVLDALRSLYDGIVDFRCPKERGEVALFLVEKGNRDIPATLLSDGTLRYLCLLAVLLHPQPPPLVCIEEPELGLHPDLLPTVSDLICDASERSQLVVTTHSDVIVDTLTEQPESVVICDKYDGETEMHRLDKDVLAKWLEDYRLGDLWIDGELGGKRW